MRNFLKDRNGFISIYMIIWMAVLIPILMFVSVDVSHYVFEGVHLKAVTDNASASAVTQIREDLVPEGKLEIDEEKAKAIVTQIMKHDLLLNDDFTPKENSVLKEKPTIEVSVVNITSKTGYDFKTPIGFVKIYKPSVVIYGEYPVKGLFYNNGVMLRRVGVSQVQFKTNN